MPSLDHALDNICCGQTVALDTVKVTIDETTDHVMLASSQLVMPAVINEAAKSYRGCCGNSSLSIASFFKGITFGYQQDSFEILVDG